MRGRDRWDVYKWVGKCLSEWEHVESALARLYDLLLDKKSPSAASRRYGEPRLFDDRAALVERAADRHFVKHPDERLKAEVLDLLSRLREAYEQRDEIAHGMVVRMPSPSGAATGRDQVEYALASRHRLWRAEADEEAPGHAWTPNDLQRAALVFFSLALDVTRHRHRLARAVTPRD
ncbi:MAG TPA: hypothetical protein PKA55_15745 [Rhodoblastus sp.]|nr:hypothetical protein [Rhodoblastus sp.]